MENINIAVVSSDEAYNRVFCMSLLDACRQIEVTSYTSRQFVLEWAQYKGPGAFYDNYDMILWAGDEIRDSYSDNIIFLTDKTSLVNMDYAGSRFAIYRYSPASTIVAELFNIYSHLTGRRALLLKRDDVRVFAFASYCGGCGCTTVCRAVCQEMARFYGRKVLYLSLEDVESAAEFIIAPEGVRSEGEFLYRLLGKNSMPFLDAYMVKDDFGVCSFAPPPGRNPLRDLSGEDMEILLASLMDSGAFDMIIVDSSTCLTDAAVSVFEAASGICITAKASQPAMRERGYLYYLNSICGETVTDRIIRITNMSESGLENSGAAGEAGARLTVAGFEGGQTADATLPLEGDFGRDISKIAETLMNVVE